MRLLSTEVFCPHKDGRPVVNGFLTYISTTDPVLMLCTGYEDYSDAYDDFSIRISEDNGRTWSDPTPWLSGRNTPDGRMRYAEPGAFFDRNTGKLIVLVDENFYPNDTLDVDGVCRVVQAIYDPATATWTGPISLDLTPARYLAVSFPFPIQSSAGTLFFPAMRPILGTDGKPLHYKGCWAPIDECLTIIGQYRPDGSIGWSVGNPPVIDVEQTSRGLDENTIAELSDGRLVIVCRGDNSMFPEKPGYKWVCYSEDGACTWSDPVPLGCDKGPAFESSATGSALFRSILDGKLYWMGNLCTGGQRPRGNYPRVPLVVAEVQEEPFALKRNTITVIGDRAPGEPPEVQMSNFRFYQDRENGDLVVFVTRYAERSAKDWMLADYYRIRVAMG
ncbi:MAG: exo-alpha-sialidase [candidate division Zixibacteria bacterium]|nr:exo-alpha-sialidase [candidate division Zixibacteria bacterium]